ncbi:type VI secretion system Vgr family protein [Azoarcus olearius]|uniref:Probable vgr related protein n=1 Tax=Azoarcus sp. (strain BH72) TaxID=418699 RepID=A1K519_AZOSB|nr:type VI secretion system Vgr family protein [Azoarcus olearius]CAL93924.1 probable vgr related protein [Azoarcus olearius]
MTDSLRSAAADLLSVADAISFLPATRLVELRFAGGGPEGSPLIALSAYGEEGLNMCHRITVRCVAVDARIELITMLGLRAAIGIRTADGRERIRCGVVTAGVALGADGGFAAYEITVEPPLALLRHRWGSRVFQALTVPEIVRALVEEHRGRNPIFNAGLGLRFDLQRRYECRSYCVQYHESDLEFIERLLAEEGIGWRFDHEEDAAGAGPSTLLVLFDAADSLPPAEPPSVRFHRGNASETEDSLTSWSAQRSVGAGRTTLTSFDYKPAATTTARAEGVEEDGGDATSLEQALEDFRPQTLHYAPTVDGLAAYAALRQQARDAERNTFEADGDARGLTAGAWFQLEGHPRHEHEPGEERRFVVTRLTFVARSNLPVHSSLIDAAGEGRAWAGAGKTPYQIRLTAVRRGQASAGIFPPRRDLRPTARGPQSAIVVGPHDEEVHTDEYGRIRIQFHWQRQEDHPDGGAAYDERSSCWVRVALPSAGIAWGHQFIPRVGQEVLVDFLDGDIDRPVVTGVLGNGCHPPVRFSGVGALPANKALSGIKSREHGGAGFNELVFDDTAGQLRARLSTEHAATQLNLGCLVHPRENGQATVRGDGAELRTDGAAAVRGARGVLVSAHGRPRAAGSQLAREELMELLEQARELARTLSDYAGSHQGVPAESSGADALLQAVRQWDGDRAEGADRERGDGLVCAAAPEGIVIATGATLISCAAEDHEVCASHQLRLTAGEGLVANAGAGIGLFAQSGDLRSIAHQGLHLTQAQQGDVVTEAARNVRVSAAEGEVLISAPVIRLVAQDGSFLRLGGGIALGTEGAVQVKAARHSLGGPATDSIDLPVFDRAGADQRFALLYPGAEGAEPQPAGGRRYEITLKDGRVVAGTADAEGRTDMLTSEAMQVAHIRVFDR